MEKAKAALVTRLVIGHFASYPMMLLSAMSTMSLAIIGRSDAIAAIESLAAPRSVVERWLVAEIALSPAEAAAFALVMEPIVYGLAALFALSHLASVPWALAARRAALDEDEKPREKRAARLFVALTAGPTGLVVLAGLVGWIVIFSR